MEDYFFFSFQVVEVCCYWVLIMSLVIAATGHRPDKLGGYSPLVLARLTDLATAYFTRTNPTQVISGMALGWDTAIALAAINLHIPLVAAVPFKGQEKRWRDYDQERYHDILASAIDVVIVCPGGYSTGKMMRRNQWMVDHCDRLLALHDGSAGGTSNCVDYAKSQDVETINLWKSWVKYRGF
jgi:uncharacterized phage-like protein YoqJ